MNKKFTIEVRKDYNKSGKLRIDIPGLVIYAWDHQVDRFRKELEKCDFDIESLAESLHTSSDWRATFDRVETKGATLPVAIAAGVGFFVIVVQALTLVTLLAL